MVAECALRKLAAIVCINVAAMDDFKTECLAVT
jgi:hypothetical protein